LSVGRSADKRQPPLKEGHNPKTGVAMKYDYLIVGAGIYGAAAAYELAQYGSVVLIEAETMPGYQCTGRSAALYTPNYGGATVRHLNQASSAFFTDPPDGALLISGLGIRWSGPPGSGRQQD